MFELSKREASLISGGSFLSKVTRVAKEVAKDVGRLTQEANQEIDKYAKKAGKEWSSAVDAAKEVKDKFQQGRQEVCDLQDKIN